MKKLFIFLFTILISSSAYGDWIEIAESADGNTFYTDIDTIKEHSGYVYYWVLIDMLIPFDTGITSIKIYKQGDCGVKGEMQLSIISYNQPMGTGNGTTVTPLKKWIYQPPGSVDASILNNVCNYID